MTLATVKIARALSGRLHPLLLPAVLWADGLSIGERLIVETDHGDVVNAEVWADASDRPRLTLPGGTIGNVAIVRRPKGDRTP